MGIDKEEWGGRGREWGWTEGMGWEGVESGDGDKEWGGRGRVGIRQ